MPGLGEDGAAANAGWGEGEWVVAEADESDASFLELRPEIAVVTNVEMDHHARWGSLAELRRAPSPQFARRRRRTAARRAGDPSGVDASSRARPSLHLAVPGRHNRAQRPRRPGRDRARRPRRRRGRRRRSPTSPACGGGSS